VEFRVEIARSLEDVARLGPVWDRTPWEREEAERDYFLTRIGLRPDVLGPFAVFVLRDGKPVAALVARKESRRLATAVGYRVVYAPRVRLLQVVDGGIVVADPAALGLLLDALRRALSRREVDAIALPPLQLGTELFTAFESLGPPVQRQHLIAPWTRRRLVLPASFEEFLASRSRKTRKAMRREAKQVEAELGDELAVETVREVEHLERLLHDVDVVARSTYQRALGAGFADTPEQRALARIGLERGWLRGYLLYLRGKPIAYWLSSVHGETMLLRTGGYDDAYARHRTGIHLLMHVIEDAIADPSLRVLDFGPGDALYKQQFSSESRQERNLVVFAPTLRALRINAARTAVFGAARLARKALDAGSLTARVRSSWRERLRIRSAA
jgi:Acetyltransferase (GNAT) domain